MAKTSVDDLLQAIKVVSYLSDTVDQQQETISEILKRLDRLEAGFARLDPKPISI